MRTIVCNGQRIVDERLHVERFAVRNTFGNRNPDALAKRELVVLFLFFFFF